MRKILNFPDELLEKIEYYQKNIFFHQFLTSTITTLIALGIRYLEEGREIIREKTPYFISQPSFYPETGQREYKQEKDIEPKTTD